MAVPETFDYFFDLPGELRAQILSLLLVQKCGIIIGSDKRLLSNTSNDEEDDDDDESDDGQDEYDPESDSAWPVNYFLVSQVFNREATAVYFHDNTFYIQATGRKYISHTPSPVDHLQAVYTTGQRFHQHGLGSPPPPPGEALLNRPEWARSRRRIRKVVLYVQRPRGSLSADVFAPLLDMILAGGLKTLEVRLPWHARRGWRVLASAPMRSLYRVLSDPDLDVARLRVLAGRHEEFWCAFHERDGLARGPCATAGGVGEGLAWVDVDVGALIREHGGVEEQLRIFKVGD